MTRAEKVGLEAYPENISYSTLYNTMMDFNAEKRRVFIEGYEQGYMDAARKVYCWLENHNGYQRVHDNGRGVRFDMTQCIIDLKKFMEEQE